MCLDLIYDRRRPRRREGYDPLQAFLEIFADVKSVKAVKEDRSGWSVEERLKHRIIDGDREGLTVDLDEALADDPGADHRQRRAARRHEGRRRAVRQRPDAAPVRAPVRRDDEGLGRLPRAAHGARRRRDEQGQARHRDGQGRRPRHRQEPRRHHLHQQRLRGPQPRHQGRHRRHGGEGEGGRRRRARA